MLCEEAVVYENEEVRAEATALNYYHLSPHIRAQVLCAPPRTRYVFLSKGFGTRTVPFQQPSARPAVWCSGAHKLKCY